MYNLINSNNQNPFIKFIGNLDFEKFYTPKKRLICHFTLWFSYFVLYLIHYCIGARFSIQTSFILSFRTIINNMFVFYLFFYFILPLIFKYCKNIKLIIVWFICLTPICIYLWDISNYFMFKVYHNLNIEINNGVYKGYVKQIAEGTLTEIFSPYKIMGEAMIIIYSFTVPFFIKIVFDIARLFSKNMQIQKQKLDLEIQNINIEKKFLKAQLNPHFLFNTLNNLYGLSVKKDDSASEVVLNLSDIMAYTLYESNTEKVILQKELDFIENYFSLEKMRYSGEKDIQLQIEKNEDISGLYIAPLLTFTFIENAFKYGLKSVDCSFLRIFIQISDDIFSFKLKNDKNSNKTKEKQTNIGGIGIENVKKRLQLLYPNRYTLTIEDKENEFHVSLQIKLK